MSQRAFRSSWSVVAVVAGLCAMVGMGMECPNADTPGLDPTPAPINTAPRVVITDVRTPAGDNSVEQGGLVEIDFSGSDNEDRAMVRVFASVSPNPTPTDEIQVLSNFPIGPGTATGTAFWPTNTVPEGSYTVFAEINDGTFDNSTNPKSTGQIALCSIGASGDPMTADVLTSTGRCGNGDGSGNCSQMGMARGPGGKGLTLALLALPVVLALLLARRRRRPARAIA